MLRLITAPLPGFIVPRIGDALRLLSVRYAACDDGQSAALAGLFRTARERKPSGVASLVWPWGCTSGIRSAAWSGGIPRFTFKSLAFATSSGGAPGVCQSWPKGFRLRTTRLFELMEKYW